MANYILEFNDHFFNLEQAGGKGLALARLFFYRVPVPDGFVITTDAYKRFVEDNGITSQILALYENLDMTKLDNQQRVAETITPLFTDGSVYEGIEIEVSQRFKRLAAKSVAVRSSATCEDMPSASFAGLHETFLNVIGVKQTLNAVVRTWASLWTQRAIAYRARHNIHPASVAMAVIIQEMVPARSAGVMFTMNPVNGERNELLITSSWGLGEGIMKGSITPDSIVVQKTNRKVLSKFSARKSTRIGLAKQGTREERVPFLEQRKSSLTPRQVDILTQWGLIIEKKAGAPVDIEWVLRPHYYYDPVDESDHTIEIVQARPLTKMPPLIPRWQPPKPGLLMVRGSLAEQIPNPVTPLFGTLGLRMVNLPAADLGRKILGKHGNVYQYATINGYVYLVTASHNLSTPSIIKSALGPLFQQFRLSHETWRTALGEFKQFVHLYEGINLQSMKNLELLDATRNLTWASGKYYTTLQATTIPNGLMSEMVFRLSYNAVKGKTDPPAQTLLYGLRTETLRSEKFLFDLALRIQLRPALADYLRRTPSGTIAHAISAGECPAIMEEDDCRPEWVEFVGSIESYFDEFGYTSYQFDFSQPTPGEVPWVTLGLLKMYLNGKARSPYMWENQCDEIRASTLKSLEDSPLNFFPSWLEWSLQWAKRSLIDKEDSLSALFLAFPIIRLHLAELGRRFVAVNIINQVEDIYWLFEEEVVDLVERLEAEGLYPGFQKIVDIRKEEWIESLRLSPPVMSPEGRWMSRMMPWIKNEKQNKRNVLHGTASSAGTYSGVARVIFTPEEFSLLKEGEILVVVTTTPAWTPLFNLAGAIVTDIGGVLSHSSIIAREYDLPAVVATGNATRRIITGQLITVDGDRGEVVLS